MKKLAAALALSLVGVIPAGVAWAHHENDHDTPPGCENGEAKGNKHCDDADQPPRNEDRGQSSSAPAPKPSPKHRLDDLDGDGTRNADDKCALQASNGCGNQNEQTYDFDGDKRPDVVDACSSSQGCNDADVVAQYKAAVEYEANEARGQIERGVADARQKLPQP